MFRTEKACVISGRHFMLPVKPCNFWSKHFSQFFLHSFTKFGIIEIFTDLLAEKIFKNYDPFQKDKTSIVF